MNLHTYLKTYPDENGMFGEFGGMHVDENLQKAMREVDDAYNTICKSRQFIAELRRIREEYQGRPTPVYHAERLSKSLGNVQIYLKREDLNYTGAHKLNHCMGEVLLAKYMGKTKVIGETGAGQHGLALATAAAYFDLECDIYMGEVDMKKQSSNVAKMELLGAKVKRVTQGRATLKDAVDAAFAAYLNEYETALYCIGSVVGPHPFPKMVRDFQTVIGTEAKEQFYNMTGELPDTIVACVGGGSNSIGFFLPFIEDPVEIIGVESIGEGKETGKHSASMSFGEPGVMHGFNSYMLKDEQGNPAPAHSVASGLDYPSIGPEHAFLRKLGRTKYDYITDEEAVEAFYLLAKLEGIIPALESAHAVAYAIKLAKQRKTGSILVNLSGRGDKDVDYVLEHYKK
ncbi:MAG: tryptophan synthase subunit beta [Erysipelotrichaceae bacterium]|nr:tryptophan synthase subunit beta [Erysipelotrichaceae bacterium]